jgi:hypothetical protein
MEKWVEIRKGAPFQEISGKFGIDPVIARIMRNRDIIGDEAIQLYLHGDLSDLEDPLALDGIREAARILHERIREEKRIRVIGDYDIDGVCASFILVRTLRLAGALADYAIPDRLRDGYGLNLHLIEQALEDGIDTIITCDNGIAALEQVRYAKEHGMTVIVTDHHEPLYEEENGKRTYLLPEADAVIDPRKPGCAYPNKNLCGCGVAFKLICAMEGDLGCTEMLEHFGGQNVKLGILSARADLAMQAGMLRPELLEGVDHIMDDENLYVSQMYGMTTFYGNAQKMEEGYYSTTYSAIGFVKITTDAFGDITLYAQSAINLHATQVLASAMFDYKDAIDEENGYIYEISAGKWSRYTAAQIARFEEIVAASAK